jgi:2-keto-4-pentenoate hydratase/2-oxohepta-3-ene-1,7-dioic acid hydratase in catechol pathway
LTRRVRYTLDSQAPATLPDASGRVQYGMAGSDVPEGARILPPCSPSKIVCVGRNYREHARELGNEVPAEPLIFLKPPSSLIGDGDPIVYPAISSRVDFEGELGLIVGRRCRNLRPGEAESAILGFTCVNDVTARDLQKQDGQWTRGKGFDTFCAAGPWMVPRDEVRFEDLRVKTYVDGELKQDGSVQDMIFGLDVILTYVTRFMTLEPGDLIATGTPPGVGPMLPGCTVAVEIAGIGSLRNPVEREPAA